MRIYENNFAYELEQTIDPATQIKSAWRYIVYRVRPRDEKLSFGYAPSMESAEKQAKKEIAKLTASQSEEESAA